MEETVGSRIRAWRRRRDGMSQKLLADLAGVTQSYISVIESGNRPLDRRSTQIAIANALNISVAQLMGFSADRTDPLLDRALKHVPAVRQVLVELSTGERRAPVRGRDELVAAAGEAMQARSTADHASLMPTLPDLLLDLAGSGVAMTPDLVGVVDAGVYALKAVGYPDLARSLIEVVLPTVQEFDSPQWTGQSRYIWVQSFPPESSALGAKMAMKAADELQGSPDPEAQQVYGHLHLMSALTAAVSLRQDDARAHLREAEDLAQALGEPQRIGPIAAGFNGNWFGPTNVGCWRMAVAAELGDLSEALAVSDRIDLGAMPVPSRWVYYWTDLARALASAGRDREALHALGKAERAAPQHFRFNPAARELIHSLMTRAKHRAVGAELSGLARTLGLDPL